MSLDEKGLRVEGFGSLAASPLRYDWYYEFNDEGKPADLKATSVLNPDILNTFGLVGRAYLTGEIPVELEAKLDGTNLRAVDAAFDLYGARLDVAEVNWVKPQNIPASATLRYAIDAAGMPTTSATLEAEDAAFDGTFTLEPDGRLIAANVERAFLKDRADISGMAFRTEEGALSFQMTGEYLDLSPIFGGVGQLSGSTSGAANFGDMTFNAEVKRLRLREGLETTNATLSLVSARDGLQTIEADGILPNGADFSAAFDTSGLGDPTFLINSGDAGFLLNVIFGLDTLQGGTLQMSGTLATGDLPTQVRLVIEDGRLTEAPFFTQVLSLASLRGISDTMTGEGVLFSTIEVALTIVGDRFNIVGARASGPALGVTARGWLALNEGTLDIDGVLVPSFGVNSALGGIPVLGSLFVSREGEGVISLRYGIEGTLERAQVSVNPLSAITPGIIRRIFENPEDEDLFKDVPITPDAPSDDAESETSDNAPAPSP